MDQTFEERMEAIARSWELYAADYQTALDRALVERPEAAFAARASVLLLAYETTRRWALDVAAELGIAACMVWSDAQFLATFVMDDTDEMLEIGIDVTDPDHIRLFWTTVLYHGNEPHPLPDYATALEAAREYLEVPSRTQPRLF